MTIIALDIGGTKIKAALVNNNFSINRSIVVPTQATKGKKHVLDTIYDLIGSLLLDNKVTAIGISMPGIIAPTGNILFAGGILSFLKGTNLKMLIERKFSLPVLIANDADCFTLAEATLGSYTSAKTILGIIWGSGLGAGLVTCDKRTWKLSSFPLELGQNKTRTYVANKPLRLEEITGGYYILEAYRKKTGKQLTTIADLYKEKNTYAQQLLTDMVLQLGKTLANLVNLFNPDIIVLGGGVAQLPQPIYTQLNKHIQSHCLSVLYKKTTLKRYAISSDAGLLGAAILAKKLK